MSDEPHKPTEAELAGEAPSDASPEAPDAPEASASAEGVTEAQTPADASSLPDAAHHEHDAPEHDPHHDDYHHDHPNRVRLDTTCGEIVIQLLPDAAPTTVDHFMGLVHNGFFDGLTFHRVVPGFIVQAGCPRGDGTGDCGYSVAAELNDTPHERGTVSMARRPQDRDSASSQFFICLDRDNCAHLDGQYTVFGRVVRGMDAVDQMVDWFRPFYRRHDRDNSLKGRYFLGLPNREQATTIDCQERLWVFCKRLFANLLGMIPHAQRQNSREPFF